MEKIFWIIDRNKNVVSSMSNDAPGTMWIDDTSGGQKITLTNGCAIGSYDFKTDAHHDDAVYIKTGNFIAFNDKYNKTRLYTIMTVECDGDDLDVHCEDIGLDLINEMANEWNYTTEQTLATYMQQAIGNSAWTIEYDTAGLETQTRALTFDSYTDTCLQRLEDIMSGFGFECDFEIQMTRINVTGMIIHVYQKLQNGNENSIKQRFVDGINLVSLSRSETIETLYTAVIPTGGTVDGTDLTISSIEYDDGQYYTTAGDRALYDRINCENYSRFSGTTDWNNSKNKYIYGHYSSSTTNLATLFQEALNDLKEHSQPQLSYEAKVTDLEADLGDYVTVVDQSLPQKVYIKARIQEVVNYYSVDGEDTCTLANYTILRSSANTIIQKLNALEERVAKVRETKTYFAIGTSGSYPPYDGTWSETKPTSLGDNEWIWIKTVTINDDDTQQIVYTVTREFDTYEVINTITSVEYEYAVSTSNNASLITEDELEWQSTYPASLYDTDGNQLYLYKRKVLHWSDGTIEKGVIEYETWINSLNTETNSNTKQATDTEKALQDLIGNIKTTDNINNLADILTLIKQQNEIISSQQTEINTLKNISNGITNDKLTEVLKLTQFIQATDSGLEISGYKQTGTDSNGKPIYDYSTIKTYYTNDGMHIVDTSKNEESSEYELSYFASISSKVNYAFIDGGVIGKHMVTTFTKNNVEGTAFFWYEGGVIVKEVSGTVNVTSDTHGTIGTASVSCSVYKDYETDDGVQYALAYIVQNITLSTNTGDNDDYLYGVSASDISNLIGCTSFSYYSTTKSVNTWFYKDGFVPTVANSELTGYQAYSQNNYNKYLIPARQYTTTATDIGAWSSGNIYSMGCTSYKLTGWGRVTW